jgi:capsular polysaccharide biosynthesis protein
MPRVLKGALLHGEQLNGRGNGAPMSIQSGLGRPMNLPRGEHVEDHSREEYVIPLGDLLRVVWRRLWVVALVAFVLAGSAVTYSLTRTPMYEASIKILVGQEQQSKMPSNLGSDVQGLQQLTQTVADLVDTRPVAETVIQDLDLGITPEKFIENMEVEQVPETQNVEVTYRNPDPEKAQAIANAIGKAFSDQVSEVSTSANAITATVWEEAAAPETPVSPNPLRDGILGMMLGCMLGLMLAFLLEYLDDSWRSPEEAERVSGVPTFGMIRSFEIPKATKG